jgi:guanylate kinase
VGQLFVISAPSGAGKTSLVRALLEARPNLVVSVSHTTRSPRAQEVEARDYHFVTPAQFHELVAQGAFLEHASVFDNFYGTGRAQIEEKLKEGKDVLLEIDVQGALQVRFQYPNALLIFILPPDAPTLLQRLRDRAREGEEEIEKRYREAKREIHMAKGAHAFDFFVINDTIDRAVEEIVKIMRHKRSGGI